MKYVPRREKNRKAFSSPDGLALLSKASGAAKKYNDTKTLWRESLTPAEIGEPESTPSVTVVSPKKKDENNGN